MTAGEIKWKSFLLWPFHLLIFDLLIFVFMKYSHIFAWNIHTAKNTVISPDFLMWKFCGEAQFPHSFGRFAQNYTETVPFRKIFTPGNQVKLRYFSQWQMFPLRKFHFGVVFTQHLSIEIKFHVFVKMTWMK